MKHFFIIEKNELAALVQLYMHLNPETPKAWPDEAQNGLLSAGAKLYTAHELEVAATKKDLVA